jgi:hypothetical protein
MHIMDDQLYSHGLIPIKGDRGFEVEGVCATQAIQNHP